MVNRFHQILRFGPLGLALAIASTATAGDPGSKIYQTKCASCHGASGEGSEDYPRALAGDRTVPQLARLIARTMPSDDPGTCTGEDADRVASFIYDAFYSPAAQAKNAPPRVELSRLTVRQYRNAVADLLGSFRGPASKWGDTHGLHGQYFRARQQRNNERLIERTDPQVLFDFGEVGPDPGSEKFDALEFSIRWDGSVLAPDSGEYEFVVRTDHSARLWVNDNKTPLIDAFVKSGHDTEHRGTITLLGGRAYPIRLEFSKAKQGVNDSKEAKAKRKPVQASVALEWKPPHRVLEPIPGRFLSPSSAPESFVLETPFPPDDRSVGYERGTTISKAWDSATTDAAIEVAGYVQAHLRELSGVREDAPDRKDRLRDFARTFAERAFRRPLTDDLKKVYVDRPFEATPDLDLALKRVVLLVLKSPRFLYAETGGPPDSFAVASRLSFGLWDSIPDATLWDAARSGKLATREAVVEQARRMRDDLRTWAKLDAFFLQWLRVEGFPDLAKDPEKFPEFDAETASDLRASLEIFLKQVLWDGPGDFRELFLADSVPLNGRLAKLYGVEMMPDAPFMNVPLEPKDRAGVLTHPYLLSTFAYTATSSPIHRGVFLSRSVLGRSLRPPPEAVAPLAPDLHAGLTTRERVALQTSPSACVTCHGMINPLGFGLEHFDAVGRYRSEEKGKPIDASGSYETPGGEVLPYHGARELASLLTDSEEVHKAFVEQLFHHMVKQPIRAYGPRASAEIRRKFVEDGFRVRDLMVEIVATAALAKPKPPPSRAALPNYLPAQTIRTSPSER